ncbi:MAG TPA: hypothetical protein VIN77_08740 [Aurantimonas sp.]|uniref:Uncharacterized protein n=1 Tax=Aurantimonas marianensis TaxID=2920428 RepID=A0A9X2H4S7_9HYPH|nr:hypothetical protein [Aurantimonas marianensis]MCP3055620.1 hypothetical protein [Aurantimonas marianensis]
MGDKLVPNGLSMGRKVLLQVDASQIVAHEADEPNVVVDLVDAESVTGGRGRALAEAPPLIHAR